MRHLGEIVYVLCALTSLACAILLARGYFRSHAQILLWSTLCFILLTANNFLLYLDLVVFTNVDLLPLRDLTGLLALVVLLYGLIWNAD